jgi:uncharacterized protein (DUF305 family)
MGASWQRVGAFALIVVAVASCSGAVRQSPLPARTGPNAYVAADVRFMQHMIAHHVQALVMTRLVPSRSRRADVGLLARRIEASQLAEIERMRRWLTERGEGVPQTEPHAGHQSGAPPHADMPGMASAEELARLARMTGAEFDRLFLELMIRHHEVALTMVAELFASEGAGREPEIFQFASHVDADQRAEIARMRRLQTDTLQKGPG